MGVGGAVKPTYFTINGHVYYVNLKAGAVVFTLPPPPFPLKQTKSLCSVEFLSTAAQEVRLQAIFTTQKKKEDTLYCSSKRWGMSIGCNYKWRAATVEDTGLDVCSYYVTVDVKIDPDEFSLQETSTPFFPSFSLLFRYRTPQRSAESLRIVKSCHSSLSWRYQRLLGWGWPAAVVSLAPPGGYIRYQTPLHATLLPRVRVGFFQFFFFSIFHYFI